MATLNSDDILDLKIDTTDADLFVGPRGPEFIRGAEGVAQLAAIAMRLFLGEWFLNTAKGMPWYQEFLGQENKYDERLARLRCTQVLSAVVGVVKILSLVITFQSDIRKMSVVANLRTVFGDIEVEV